MLKTNCFQHWWTTLGRQEVRNYLFCRWSSSRPWSIVAFDRWPTHRRIRGFRKACPAIGKQAFPPVIARLRTDLNHERTLLPPSWVCTSPQAVNTTAGCSGPLLLCPFLLSLILLFFLLIMRNNAPESTTISRSSGLVRCRMPALTFAFFRSTYRT